MFAVKGLNEQLVKSTEVNVYSIEKGHSSIKKISGTSMILPSPAKNIGVYRIYPDSDLYDSIYKTESKGHVFLPEDVKSNVLSKLTLHIDVCNGDLENGILPSKCASGSEHWETLVLNSDLTLVTPTN
jgi:hypothetical protein